MRNLVSRNVLGDTAGFGFGSFGPADGVKQAGLAMVDMTHKGNHRRSGPGLLAKLGFDTVWDFS